MKPPLIRWGAATARSRGPIVAGPDSAEARNAIGAHGGPYAIYLALAGATGGLPSEHRSDLSGTEPVVPIGPFPQWTDPARIVTLDPWGHRVTEDFGAEIAAGLDIRPTIAVSSGRLRIPEIERSMREGRLDPDEMVLTPDGDICVTKIAIEPVWYLPGLAERLGLDELALRSALHHGTGGSFPALLDRPDLQLFLPPVGGLSLYLLGDPARLTDPTRPVTCRMHDECNGSDVFGSDLCTCRPYLVFAVEQAILTAQAGGLGVITYQRKEGRALGEVVKLLVYNARARNLTGDLPESYFGRTERVAGLPDARLPSLSAEVLHWLGIRRVDRWISMSHLKREALEAGGIEIGTQVAIPDERIPAGADVEISAKRAAGVFHGEGVRVGHC